MGLPPFMVPAQEMGSYWLLLNADKIKNRQLHITAPLLCKGLPIWSNRPVPDKELKWNAKLIYKAASLKPVHPGLQKLWRNSLQEMILHILIPIGLIMYSVNGLLSKITTYLSEAVATK